MHLERSLAGAALVAALAGCAAPPDAARDAPDGRYDSRFPARDAAGALAGAAPAVQMVTAVTYYRVYTIPENDALLRLAPGDLDARPSRVVNHAVVGAATVLTLEPAEALLLTCAHVVSFPDTVLTYHPGERTRLSSVALRARTSISVPVIPEGGELDVVALDAAEDLALLGRRYRSAPEGGSPMPYPLGTSADLEWGSFVYVMGYPRGHLLVTHGLVSPGRHGFFIDAGMGKGFSGGPVFAVRDGLPNLEWVGIARMMPGTTSFVLVPDTGEYDAETPYQGDAFVQRQTELHFGMAQAIGADTIREFLERSRAAILAAGYAPPSLGRRGIAPSQREGP